LRRLHRHLIAPIDEAGLLAGKTRLVLVPHAELHYLPFAALVDGGGHDRFLVERYEVTMTPSASVWLALARRPSGQAAGGVLAYAPRPDALPASRQEVAAIARLLGADVHVVTGGAATEAVFRRDAPRAGATCRHVLTVNPLFSFVGFSGGDHDRQPEVHEAGTLAADLVVLGVPDGAGPVRWPRAMGTMGG
jgi:CHAT domain-containing protein